MNNRSPGMPCPIDGSQLVMSERSGIEIDYCPTCRGVWLDRGELDKIIERSAGDGQTPAAAAAQQAARYDEPRGDRHYSDRDHRPHKRRKSFFEELFD